MELPRLSLVEWCALLTISLIGFADLYSYSMPDAFLGQALTARGASTAAVMTAYGISGAVTTVTAVLVLLCQSLPGAAAVSVATKWWMIIGAQLLSVASSVVPLLWPTFTFITTSRALHGAATAVYMIYCLILLVEMSPKHRLSMGIAALTAGMTAGDSIGPVIGAIVYDRAGLRAPFLLQAGINTLVLAAALLQVPLWLCAPKHVKQQLLLRSPSNLNVQGLSLPCTTTTSSLRQHVSACTNLHQMHALQAGPASPAAAAAAAAAGAPTDASLAAAAAAASAAASSNAATTSSCHSQSGSAQLDLDVDLQADQPTCSKMMTHQCFGKTLSNEGSFPFSDEHNKSYQATDDTAQTTSDVGLCRNNSFTAAASCGRQLSRQHSFASFAQNSFNSLKSWGSFQRLSSLRVRAPKLDIKAVLAILRDSVIFSQCLLLLLEQAVRSGLLVVLPGAMATATWLVGVIYIANVAGAVAAPFAVDLLLPRYPSCATHLVSAVLSVIMGVSSILVIPVSKNLPGLAALLFAYGASQSAVEIIIYVHVAKRLDQLGQQRMTHVSMCMYLLAQSVGGGLGSFTGGALQQQGWALQFGVMGAAAGVAAALGVALGVASHRGWWFKQQQGTSL